MALAFAVPVGLDNVSRKVTILLCLPLKTNIVCKDSSKEIALASLDDSESRGGAELSNAFEIKLMVEKKVEEEVKKVEEECKVVEKVVVEVVCS